MPTERFDRVARLFPESFGASGAQIGRRTERSEHCHDGIFRNSEPATDISLSPVETMLAFTQWFRRGEVGTPATSIEISTPELPAEAADLATTWFGHSSCLVEVDGHRVLTDPMWSRRCSPSGAIGPARLHPVPMPLDRLPRVDAVIISHDHYDHLDMPSIRRLVHLQSAPFLVPLGVGAHLASWGVPAQRIVELDWAESHRIGDLVLTCTEARHFSGRGLTRDNTQWASWAITGPAHSVYFGGDTGYTAKFTEIGRALGPFDLTLLPVGAYHHLWPDHHMTPEEAIRAHLSLAHDTAPVLPIHWGTFNLAFHPWADPIDRLVAAAEAAGVAFAAPPPGGRIDIAGPLPQAAWWASSLTSAHR